MASAPDDQADKAVMDFDPAVCTYDRWIEKFGEAREKCPVFASEAHGGYWVAASYEHATNISRDWETFSSRKVWDPEAGKLEGGSVIPPFAGPPFVPVETDPPEWKLYRHLLNPFFGPKAVETYRTRARQVMRALVDRVIETGACDIVNDLANPLPALSTLDILGIPYDQSNWRRFSDPFHKLAYARGTAEFPQCLADLDWIRGQLAEQVERDRTNPREGLFSSLCNGEVAGKAFSVPEIVGLGMMVLVGGVGTTNALFSNSCVWLSKHPEVRRKLIDNPDMLPIAREEFVRFYSPVHSAARLVTREVVVNGQRMEPGEQIMVAFSSANHDEAVFENAGEIDVERFPNPHVGFGSGIHRCLGSFLARMFFETMFAEVMARMPDFLVDEERAVRYPDISTKNGWITIPATFTPGPRMGEGPTL